jgi:hypothetical protein
LAAILLIPIKTTAIAAKSLIDEIQTYDLPDIPPSWRIACGGNRGSFLPN